MANIKMTSVNSKVQLNEKRRGGFFLLLVVLVTFFFIYRVIDWMRDDTQVPMSEILVEGDLYHVSTTEIRDAVTRLGALKNFALQDVDHIQQAISTLPWVAHVSVRKQWPITIKINVTEHKPIAIWNGNKLLNEEAVVFDAVPSEVKYKKLIALYGPDGSEQEVLNTWPDLNNILQKTGLEIAELELNERRSWRIITSNNIRIELGLESKTEILERLERFVKLFVEIKSTRQAIDYVDLRYDIGVAVGWKELEATTDQL